MKALVIDVDKTTRSAHKSILESLGYQVDIAEDAKTAFALLKVNLYKAVLLGINLAEEEFDSLAIAKFIKSNQPATKVIIVTSESSESGKKFYLELGYITLQKPVQREALKIYLLEKI